MLDQPEPSALFANPDPVRALSDLMGWVADRTAQISRIWRAFDQAADSDREIAADYAEQIELMRAECRRTVTELHQRGALRIDVPQSELADVLWILILPDQHRRLCSQAGWSQQGYREWLVETSAKTLLASRLLSGAATTL